MKNLYTDIETMPAQRQDILDGIRSDLKAKSQEAIAELRAPSNYKDEAKIAEYIDRARRELEEQLPLDIAEAIADTPLDGAFGEVYCIGYAIDDEPPEVIDRGENVFSYDAEKIVLRKFFDTISARISAGRRPKIIGHNVVGFDLRFLWQRAMVNGVRPSVWFPRDPKPWGDEVFDTMVAWAGARDRVSLDKLCRALDIPGKDGFSGKDVWPAIQRGEYQRIADYCKNDVFITRAVHRRMTFEE